tara:strand:- start:437 stop:601 length:165 start_codon:yes stop_codon:yes gene_type:complete
MTYIRAKYDKTYRWYMKVKEQGFGSLYGGNRNSSITNIEDERSIENDNESNFPN